jgi:Ala-tRNA(Pro) deacylase
MTTSSEQFHPVSDKIMTALQEGGYWYERFQHEPVTTSEDAAKVRSGYSITQGAKALIVKARKISADPVCDGRFIMIVVQGDKKFDRKKLKVAGYNDARFATEEEVAQISGGVVRGGVPPWGHLFGLPILADSGIFLNEKMIFNAGDRRVSIAMKTADYRELAKPAVVDIAA